MASAVKSEDDCPEKTKGSTDSDTLTAEAAVKAKLSKKRTKTGCLTCRKRRIKCGEERPVCKNCIKSKRHCEGYNPRVVFKPPTFEYLAVSNGGAHYTFQARPTFGPVMGSYQPNLGQAAFDPPAALRLKPRPLEHYTPDFNVVGQPQLAPDLHAINLAQLSQAPLVYPEPTVVPPVQDPPQSVSNVPLPFHIATSQDVTSSAATHAPEFSVPVQNPNYIQQQEAYDQIQNYDNLAWQHHQQLGNNEQHWPQSTPLGTIPPDETIPTSFMPPKTASLDHGSSFQDSSPNWSSTNYDFHPEVVQPIDHRLPLGPIQDTQYQIIPPNMPADRVSNFQTPELYEHEEHIPSTFTSTYLLSQAAVEVQDDDYYDVQSDDEMEVDTIASSSVNFEHQRALSRVLHINDIQDLQTRRYDTFIYSGILERYRVEEVANPLRNPATARVFAHFISVTGPSLSIFERHLRNTSVLFTEGRIPASQQGLWTYSMPMAALRHQGLLHAMLAMASLHIARLQNASITPSMQHYAWALKRIHHCVGHPKKRLRLTTIAASLLLGFYEIMTAEHMKWNMHLSGSKQLFLETDFIDMMQQYNRMKLERATRLQLGRKRRSESQPLSADDDLLDQIHDPDERIISQLVGREVRYDLHGRIINSTSPSSPKLELGTFEILKDLYWWYLKQDAFQSIVSGNPLLLDYSRWANCPPRAPLGRADAVYGSFDHLILLLGRVADFSARDRERKFRVMAANGGQWKPAPGMRMPQPPPQRGPKPAAAANGQGNMGPGAGPPPFQGPSPPQMPQFYGMAPPPRENVQMPFSYRPSGDMPAPQQATPEREIDLQLETHAALEEYGRIRAALHLFSSGLGEAFEPLSSEYESPIETPFGKALFYRSYDIGCLWSVYNMAVIIAIRSHPHMHPAAHVAAALAAHETSFFANEIGRIAAGIVPGPASQPLNPSLGASLCESCLPSFFAAVQYREPQQRHETVMRIYGIALRTGWGSAELIANGCETAWVKAAAMGRGPPYQRIARPTSSDDPRLNGSWERLDPDAIPDEKDDSDRRLIKSKPTARLNWAVGVMGTEDDVNATLAI